MPPLYRPVAIWPGKNALGSGWNLFRFASQPGRAKVDGQTTSEVITSGVLEPGGEPLGELLVGDVRRRREREDADVDVRVQFLESLHRGRGRGALGSQALGSEYDGLLGADRNLLARRP